MTEVIFVSGEAQTMNSVNVVVLAVIYESYQNGSILPTARVFCWRLKTPGEDKKACTSVRKPSSSEALKKYSVY